MWPTYNGMTPQVFRSPAAEPNPVAVAARAVVFGAWPHRLDAPVDGEILIPVGGERRSLVHCKTVPGRTWLVLPTQLRMYSILVGDSVVTTKLPMDFDFDWAVYDAFFRQGDEAFSPTRLETALYEASRKNGMVRRVVDGEEVNCIRVGKTARAGERVLSFDERTGDQLFVDRISYHFIRPHVVSGFVFRTGHIPGIAERAGDQYYIKRLVGTPGDKIEIQGTGLYRNGSPISGSTAFDANAHRTGNYGGYVALGRLAPGESVTVPADGYFALGDNSANSEDGR
jgi:signal peptidase I